MKKLGLKHRLKFERGAAYQYYADRGLLVCEKHITKEIWDAVDQYNKYYTGIKEISLYSFGFYEDEENENLLSVGITFEIFHKESSFIEYTLKTMPYISIELGCLKNKYLYRYCKKRCVCDATNFEIVKWSTIILGNIMCEGKIIFEENK